MNDDLDLGPTSKDWLMTIASPYPEAVKRLTAENRQLRDQLTDEQRARKDEVRALKAQLREGLSPELIVLRKQLASWRDRAQAAEARLKEANVAR